MGVIGVRMLVCDLKSHPKISAFELRIGGDLGGGAGERELALLEDIGAVRDLEALHHVLLDQQDGEPLAR